MKKQRIFCLLLALAMTASFTACKKSSSDDGSLSDDVEIVYEYQSGTSGQTSGDSSGKTDSKSGKTSSSQTTSGGKKNNTKMPDNFAELAKKYNGTTVRYATWADPKKNEDAKVVEDFTKKYGIKFQLDLVGQLNYSMSIASRIAAGNPPDIYFCNNDFPAALSCLQPIDTAQIDKTDPIWDQGMFNLSTINGKTYLVNTVGNIWNEVDCVFYNKKLFNENNITTPEEYYKAGNWTFDTMKKAMQDVKALGSDYIGGYLDWETVLGCTGVSYYKWENGKFSNGIDSKLKDVSRYLATCLKDGLIKGLNDYNLRDDFINGKVGIALTNAYGLKKTGYWSKMNADNIGFTYLPDWSKSQKAVTTGLFRGWGIVKGSKNPVAAGLFLRYYLDVNNYNTSSAFINSAAESFFFKITSGVTTEKKNLSLINGTRGVTGNATEVLGDIAKNDPSQIETAISAVNNTVNNDVKTLNDFVAKQTK